MFEPRLIRPTAFLSFVVGICVCAVAHANSEGTGHPGPVISAYVNRGNARLPIYQVAHLRKGDKLEVVADRSAKFAGQWLLVLATISPTGNKVVSNKFHLSDLNDNGEIDIDSDDEVPVIVLAPQVHTFFGLNTSFNQSAKQIADAIAADPQRFVDLQKIDQINHAVEAIAGSLDAAVQNQKPENAVDSIKSLASKFGTKNVDPECFKGDTVNTKCVAANIVSNKDLTVPSVDDLGALVGPLASADLSEQMLANIRLFAAASAFLKNKYRDQYDFSPSSGERQDGGDKIQLYSNARFKNGSTKTAYVYVPSWFSGQPPGLVIGGDTPACLSAGALKVKFTGSLPVTNYWHDWELTLRASGSSTALMRTDKIAFDPEKGLFSIDFGKISKDLPSDGQLLDATLMGHFGFSTTAVPVFKVAAPFSDHLQDHMVGLDNLVSGEHARLHFSGAGDAACIKAVTLIDNGSSIASSANDSHDKLDLDLTGASPGKGVLQVDEYGMPEMVTAVQIKKRKAHIDHIEHFDLENEITVFGDNLQRIDSIQAGSVICHAASVPSSPVASAKRVFACPADVSDNQHFPAQVTIVHLDQEPTSFDAPVTKLSARPHMTVDGSRTSITTLLSSKAVQWGLTPDAQLLTEDSNLSLLLHAFGGYELAAGTYNLQIKFADDPQTEQTPLSFPLIANRAHNELRTRIPLSFLNSSLPNIVNPIWYRVQHQQTGLVGDWQPLNRAIVTLPVLNEVACDTSGGYLVQGSQLDQIDWTSNDLTSTAPSDQATAGNGISLKQCDKGQCLAVAHFSQDHRLRIKVHWIDDRLFDVTFPTIPSCSGATKS